MLAGMPEASTTLSAFESPFTPVYWASSRFLPTAFYALVMQPSTATSESSRPMRRS
jgi:hypothetical protein